MTPIAGYPPLELLRCEGWVTDGISTIKASARQPSRPLQPPLRVDPIPGGVALHPGDGALASPTMPTTSASGQSR
jgi:hypothetical protein